MRADLGLSRNPFEPYPPEAIERVLLRPPELTQAIETGARCIQIVGQGGQGKTTQLLGLARWAESRGESAVYHLVPPGSFLVRRQLGGWLLLDETQRLGRGELEMLVTLASGRGCRVVIGSHRDHRRELSCDWLEPLVTVWLRGVRQPEEAAGLLDRYLAAAGGDWALVSWDPAAVAAMVSIAGGNVDALLRLGYEIFEDLDRPRRIAVPDVRAAAAALRRDSPALLDRRARRRDERAARRGG